MPDLLRRQSLLTRWLGVGLAAILSVVTLSLVITGRISLYINPDSAWFAAGMSVVILIGTIGTFALPLGAEADHGHDHGDTPEPVAHGLDRDHADADRHQPTPAGPLTTVGAVGTAVGGVAASGVVVLSLVLAPATLSAELAMSRDTGAAPLFAGSDAVTLATTGDTASFGVGEWAAVFATSTNPDAFAGDEVELVGFATPSESGDFSLTRLVITHCVIDAQPASIPVVEVGTPETGQWVSITGTVRSTSDGRLEIAAASIEEIPEPADPYEY
ncbi:TIGR03943 family protein [Microbacterium chocolatum]|uniref:TIGR03943 family putative permease subunit n=1 Tax=Microbacterium aurantiacum TaxID=162393 RepID=UPI00338F65DA